tara:strand:- start:1139 stop:1792 length:654 start_codon:yes stop_codon:yes gene_type:complete
MKWNETTIDRVSLSITNFCNAACPQCHRTNANGLGVADWLPLVQWSLKEFKESFPKDTLNEIKELQFCGTWGDPLMLKDLYDICYYIINESETNIEITTNGSIRDEQYYWELGVLCGRRLKIFFDIDGIDQEMHSHYRRKTDLQKTLNNMKALSETLSTSMAQTVVFEHNRPYLKDIEKLTKKYGATYWRYFDSNRFDDSGIFKFIDENGKEQILRR